VEYAGGCKWDELTDQSDDLVVHKWSCTGLSIHRTDQCSARSVAELPWSTTEVVKVTDSIPASGRSRRASSVVVTKAVAAVVAKAGAVSAAGACGERLAPRHLAESGTQILDPNWPCGQGETDVVVMDDTWTVTGLAGGGTPNRHDVELALTLRAHGAVAE